MSEFAMKTITEIAPLLQTRALSPVELTQQMLKRIEGLDGQLHSYVTVLSEEAMAQARVAEAEIMDGQYRGPLHGVPIAIKDICLTRGHPTTCGSEMFRDWIAEEDATVVRKLADAGAILLGKLHMTEFALRWHHPYRPIPINPWNPSRWSGVSSSGSGVATSAGLCFGSLGTDTGGSIRFPAATCGIVGLKQSYGRVSRYGVFPLAESLDNIGPLCRSVTDAAIMLGAIAGQDSLDPTSSHLPVPDYLSTLSLDAPQDIRGIRIGVDTRFITEGVHPEVTEAVQKAIHFLEKLGAEIVEVQVPDVTDLGEIWRVLCYSEGVVAHEASYPERADEYGPFRALLEKGSQISGAAYAKAHMTREAFTAQLNALYAQIDILACPTMAIAAPPLHKDGQPIVDGYNRSLFTYPFSLSRNPTLVLPCGFDSEGIPLSLQLVGRHFEEAVLCQVGHAYEQATEWHMRQPPLSVVV